MPISDAVPAAAGDVVVVPFPYADKLAEKRRPALVVSNGELAGEGVLWLVMITSTRRAMRHDVAIPASANSGLAVPCAVRPVKMACVDPLRIVRIAGRLPAPVLRDVQARIRSFLTPS